MSTAPPVPRLPRGTWCSIFARLLAIQSAWNYELMLGMGIGFSIEPALRQLPGGMNGGPYRAALARQSAYFNAHPYLAAIAVGALARAELEERPPAQIDRFRTALAGPLGSVGDRLVWAGWLPFCSLLALAAFAMGHGARAVLLIFLIFYNVGHIGLRVWGLRVGWEHGMRVAGALAHPLFRQAPQYIARASALLAGVAVPLALDRIIGPGRALLGGVLLATVVGATALARLQGRVEGWRLTLVLLAAVSVYAVASR